MFDQTFDPAQAGSRLKEFYTRRGPFRFLPSAFYEYRHHPAKLFHLRGSDRVARVRRQARVEDPFDVPGTGRRGGYGHCVRAVLFHAARQGPQSAQNQPRIKRRADRAQHHAHLKQLLVERCALLEDQASSLHIAVATAIFCGGVPSFIRNHLVERDAQNPEKSRPRRPAILDRGGLNATAHRIERGRPAIRARRSVLAVDSEFAA